MNTKYLKLLEYDKIIEKISSHCKTYIGNKKALALLPEFNQKKVLDLLSITDEAISLVYRKGNIPLSTIPDISASIKLLKGNGILSIAAILNIAKFLKISREIKEYFFSFTTSSLDMADYQRLNDLFELIYSNKTIEDKIFSIIIDENTIADNASTKLASIRRESRKLEQNIRDKLNSIIHSNEYSKYIMEPIVTIRENRYVVPVKEEYKSKVKGFIHDVSSSGSTVFIEPVSVFEINNEISNLRVEEEIEIEKILADLSDSLCDYTNDLYENIDIIGRIDLIFAKASYSIEIDGILPTLNNEKYVNLIAARHPLIEKDIVVPIDISIGHEYSSLVITGPNTGGKTVALKTTGLLLLMAYSGIFIPAKENSSIYIFDDIFVDIGDEQSIQENLSTFSSHISNIVEITKNVTSESMVLLDELGSGTDPIEGANLAISILKYLFEIGATTISTTHYQELKNYCLTNKGFKNASFEFDLNNLKPTYKLLIGIPGKSNAFAISRRLGLNDKILGYAEALMKEDDVCLEEVMKKIYDDKIKIEEEKEEIEKNANQIQSLRKSLEKENTNIKERQNKILSNAKAEAKDILQTAKAEANAVIKELSELLETSKAKGPNNAELSTANKLRNNLNEKLKSISSVSNDEKINLESLQMLNEKFSLKNNKLKDNQLNTGNNRSKKTGVTFSKGNSFKAQNISSEINVIGLTVEEATFLIDKYLDDCAIAKLSPVRIVHGKGTGRLREGIHKFLKTNSHVQSFRLGTFGEGEMGVTVVELK